MAHAEPVHIIGGEKLIAPAAERNKDAILTVLRELMPSAGSTLVDSIGSDASGDRAGLRVLEVAAGTGQHAVFFTEALGSLVSAWVATDADERALSSLAAYRADAPPHVRAVLQPPRLLDVLDAASFAALGRFDAILSVNLVHISPPAVCRALFVVASASLVSGGLLMLYGPMLVNGEPTTPSNALFDAKLRAMDRRFGLRDVGALERLAAEQSLSLVERREMPSNNFMLIFKRA